MSERIGYSILIIDDEKLIRQKILHAIRCDAYNIVSIEEAANGVEGLLLIMQNVPDIILLDICMPRMDGIEFASIVRKDHPDTQIIFISGLSDFKNMRSAIQVGANDYILKPIDSRAIETAIGNAVTRLRQNVHPVTHQAIHDPVEVIYSLMASPSEVLDERLRLILRLPINYECRVALICNDFSLFEKWNEEDVRKFVQFAVVRVAAEIQERKEAGIAFLTPRQEPALLLTCCEKDIEAVLNDLSQHIDRLLEIELKYAISNSGSFSQIAMLYRQSIEVSKRVFNDGDPFLLYYWDLQDRNIVNHEYPVQLEKEMCEKLFLYGADSYEKTICSFFDHIEKNNIDVSTCRLFLMRLFTHISISIDMYNNVNNGMNSFQPIDPVSMVYQCSSLQEARQILMRLFANAHEYYINTQNCKGDHFHSIDCYIRSNYSDSTLNMKKCSEELYLSYSYISRILKKRVGKTFIEYLNEIRINEACRLLQSPGALISETAIVVGFSHQSYFNVVFKRVTGVTPTQFRGLHNEK